MSHSDYEMVRYNISLHLNDNIICFIAFLDVFSTTNGFRICLTDFLSGLTNTLISELLMATYFTLICSISIFNKSIRSGTMTASGALMSSIESISRYGTRRKHQNTFYINVFSVLLSINKGNKGISLFFKQANERPLIRIRKRVKLSARG